MKLTEKSCASSVTWVIAVTAYTYGLVWRNNMLYNSSNKTRYFYLLVYKLTTVEMALDGDFRTAGANGNTFGDFMKRFGVRRSMALSTRPTDVSNYKYDSVVSESDPATRYREYLLASSEEIKNEMERTGSNLAGSKLRTAISSQTNAVMMIKVDKEGSKGLGMKGNSKLVPETLDFTVPQRAATLLESACMDADTAFNDHTNISIPFKIEAIKIQMQCTLLLTKDDSKTCVDLMWKHLNSLWLDRHVKKIMAEKVKSFGTTRKTTSSPKYPIIQFAKELMNDLPALHKLGFHFDNVPPILNCFASPECIPLGWWEGLPVILINGDNILDVPWHKNVYVELGNEVQFYLNTESFEFQTCKAGLLWSNNEPVIVNEEVYANDQSLHSGVDMIEKLKYSSKSGDEIEATCCLIKIKKFLDDRLCVWTPSGRIIIFSDTKFFVTWPLKSMKNADDWSKPLSSLKNKANPAQIMVPVEAKQKDITTLLSADDYGDDKIAVFVLNADNTTGWHVITKDKMYADYSQFITIPAAEPENPTAFYLDLLRWSDAFDALINISAHDNGMFQFRLIDKNGATKRHTVVSVGKKTVFPPEFQWKLFDKTNIDERETYKRESSKGKTIIFKNNCIYLCSPFRFVKGALVFDQQVKK